LSFPTHPNKDCWSYWYPGKAGAVEPDLKEFETLLLEEKRKHSKAQDNPQRILDIGCGTGRHVIKLAKNHDFEVYGFDFSYLAIESANIELRKTNLSARLEVHDMTERFNYNDAFFDGILSTRVIGHAYTDQIKQIAREIDRVLQLRGYLFLQVPSHESETKSIEEKGGKDRVKFVDQKTHIPLDGPECGIPHYHFTKEELLGDFFPNYDVLMFHEGTEHYDGICFIGRKNMARISHKLQQLRLC
jgi:cyclopropane fatty-acyl-phospholipid synthase-like methyltransferase